MKFENFTITENDANRRVDRVVRKMFSSLPLSKIYSLLRTGKIRVNGKKTDKAYLLKVSDTLQVPSKIVNNELENVSMRGSTPNRNFPKKSFKQEHKNFAQAKPKNTSLPNLNVLYKDKDFLVLNKERNVLVHGRQSLDAIVKAEYAQAENSSKTFQSSLSFTPGPLHRLDGGTSGIVVFSQSLAGAQNFSEALKQRKVLRFYLALLEGFFSGEKEIVSKIAEKPAKTKIRSLAYFKSKNLTLAEVQIFSGRKHQIRIHCSENGFPLFGDNRFSKKNKRKSSSYFLHFYKMELTEKILNLPMQIIATPPKAFQKILQGEWEKIHSNFF
ncbi:MAG: RluA family pseudouridine synthase [Treponemataceae bacterium]